MSIFPFIDFKGLKWRTIGLGKIKGDTMARIGYARVSSTGQNLDRQLEALVGMDRVFFDKESGSTLNRPQLTELLSFIREGDIVTVTELDRLGRNNKELTQVMNQIQETGATLDVLGLPTLQGIQDNNLRLLLNNLILEIYKYQAEAERQKIKQRQAEGIVLAKAQGKYKGRKSLFSEDDGRLQHAFELYRSGYSDKDVALMSGINERTFRRYREKYEVKR